MMSRFLNFKPSSCAEWVRPARLLLGAFSVFFCLHALSMADPPGYPLQATFIGGHTVRGISLDQAAFPLGYFTSSVAEYRNIIGGGGGSDDRRQHNPILVFALPEQGPVYEATLAFVKAGGTSSQRDVDLYGLDPTAPGFILDETLFWNASDEDTRDFAVLLEAGVMGENDPEGQTYAVDVTTFIQGFYDAEDQREVDQVYFRLNLDTELDPGGLRRQEVHNMPNQAFTPVLLLNVPTAPPVEQGSLMAYWDFEHGLENLVPDGLDAVAWSGNPLIGVFEGKDALVGNALVLDGASSIQLPYHLEEERLATHGTFDWRPPAFGRSFTIAGWYWVDGSATPDMTLLSGDDGNSIGITRNGNNLSTWLSGTQMNPADPVSAPTETWRHFAFVVTFNPVAFSYTLDFYDNGVWHHSGSTTQPPTGNALRIGQAAGSETDFWIGMVDEWGIWSGPLTASEVWAIYEKGLAGEMLDIPPTSTASNHDPVAYWSFDTGFANDAGDPLFDGNPINGASIDPVEGPFDGGSLWLNRNNGQHVHIPNSPFGTGDYTYVAWYRLNMSAIASSNARYFILEASNGGNYPASLGLRALSGIESVQVWLHSPEGTENFAAPAGTLDVWRHVAVTYSVAENGIKLYLDGELVNANPVPGEPSPSTFMNIGEHRGGTDRNWHGWLAEVAVWNRVLTDEEITSLQTMRVPDAMRFGRSGYKYWIDNSEEPVRPSARHPLADATGSGVSNMQRYAAGSTPNEHGTGLRPTLEFDTGSAIPSFITTIDRNPEARGLNFTIEYSHDLLNPNWTPLQGNILEDVPDRLRVQFDVDDVQP